MTIINSNYEIQDAQFGLKRIVWTGRATAEEQAGLERNVVTRYTMITLPSTRGAIMKPLDGTRAKAIPVKPPTMQRTYMCVKVMARCEPFTPAQPVGSDYVGVAIIRFVVTYQEVGGVA